jgi:hypothetical protein
VTLLVLLVLAVMWASVLIPPYVRSRHEGRVGGVGSYRQLLSALDRRPVSNGGRGGVVHPFPNRGAMAHTGPVGPFGGPSRNRKMTLRQAQKRRRDIISLLLGVASVTLLFGMGFTLLRPLLVLHVLADLLLVTYVGLLASARRVAIERETKVHFLPSANRRIPAAAAGEPLLLLQRVGG